MSLIHSTLDSRPVEQTLRSGRPLAPRIENPCYGAGPALRAETRLEDVIPDPAFILGLVYLEAGLPPEAALRFALADYECSFRGVEVESL